MCGETTTRSSHASATVFFMNAPTASNGRVERLRQGQFQRRGAATEAQRAHPARDPPQHRIVGRPRDRAVMLQESVGHVRERFVPPRRRRSSTGSPLRLPDVATSARAEGVHQQMMQRAVRQHHADLAQAGRDRRRQRRVVAALEQHDRTRRINEACGFRGGDRRHGRARRPARRHLGMAASPPAAWPAAACARASARRPPRAPASHSRW